MEGLPGPFQGFCRPGDPQDSCLLIIFCRLVKILSIFHFRSGFIEFAQLHAGFSLAAFGCREQVIGFRGSILDTLPVEFPGRIGVSQFCRRLEPFGRFFRFSQIPADQPQPVYGFPVAHIRCRLVRSRRLLLFSLVQGLLGVLFERFHLGCRHFPIRRGEPDLIETDFLGCKVDGFRPFVSKLELVAEPVIGNLFQIRVKRKGHAAGIDQDNPESLIPLRILPHQVPQHGHFLRCPDGIPSFDAQAVHPPGKRNVAFLMEVLPQASSQEKTFPFRIRHVQDIRNGIRRQLGHGKINGKSGSGLSQAFTKGLHGLLFAVPAIFQHHLEVVHPAFDFFGPEVEGGQLVAVFQDMDQFVDQPDGNDVVCKAGSHPCIVVAVQTLPDEPLGPAGIGIAGNGPSQGAQSVGSHVQHAGFHRPGDGPGDAKAASLPVGLVHLFFLSQLLQIAGNRRLVFGQLPDQVGFLVLLKEFVQQIFFTDKIDAVIHQGFHRRIHGRLAGIEDNPGQEFHQGGRVRIVLHMEVFPDILPHQPSLPGPFPVEGSPQLPPKGQRPGKINGISAKDEGMAARHLRQGFLFGCRDGLSPGLSGPGGGGRDGGLDDRCRISLFRCRRLFRCIVRCQIRHPGPAVETEFCPIGQFRTTIYAKHLLSSSG